MGLALLANLSACDFGYISAGQLIERTHDALHTMESLERYRGHFYNWYDTQSLKPLPPLYISTVDSGNLAGHLLTLRAGLHGASRSEDPGTAIVRRARGHVESSCGNRGRSRPAQLLNSTRIWSRGRPGSRLRGFTSTGWRRPLPNLAGSLTLVDTASAKRSGGQSAFAAAMPGRPGCG